MAITLVMIFCGFLDGMSEHAIPFVLPQVELIFSIEPGQRDLKVFDLNGHKLTHELMNYGTPIYVGEGADKIFINYLNDIGGATLVICDRGLKWRKVINNCSLYYPNILQGKLYGFDYVNHAQKPFRFPFLAHEFDVTQATYGSTKFFKLPPELQRSNRYPEPFWLFQLGDVKLAITSKLPKIFVLNDRYLKEESIVSQNMPSNASQIPLSIAFEFKNFELPEMELRKTFVPKFRNWLKSRTTIMVAWESTISDQGIFFCYGSAIEGTSKAVLIDPSLHVRHLKTIKGTAVSGFGDRVWTVSRTGKGLWVESFKLVP